MTNLINIENSLEQSIGISAVIDPQRIVIRNEEEQSINIFERYENHRIDINQQCKQNIEISMPCPCKVDLEVAIDSKVPKNLSILSQASSDAFDTINARENNLIYVDVGGTPSFANIEQIKALNTKIILAEDINDKNIEKLSNGDFVLLRERH